ncbi:MAG: hypothetical protein R6X08_05280 [Desulfosalsimonadaceae bacterium]
MIHEIKPACEAEFAWIIGLQRDLLSGVCQEEINADTVTIDWVKSLRPDIDADWVEKFCNRKDRLNGIKRPLIKHLQVIADCDNDIKHRLQSRFENNHNFKNAFDPAREQAHPLRPLNSIPDIDSVIDALRGFFTTFYDPSLYKQYGFPVTAGGTVVEFDRDLFLDEFYKKNRELGVCVLCDGDLGDADVDHFYSKKVYPELSCHPANLVPICKTCNQTRKGGKVPLDEHAGDPMRNWFHPYYRVAQGRFSVDFEEKGNKIYPVLKALDPVDQTRLDNLDELIGLSSRWRRKLRQMVRATAKRFRHSNIEDLQSQLLEAADNIAAFDIKHRSGAVLYRGFCKKVGEGYKPLLDELRVEIGNLDPLTAT